MKKDLVAQIAVCKASVDSISKQIEDALSWKRSIASAQQHQLNRILDIEEIDETEEGLKKLQCAKEELVKFTEQIPSLSEIYEWEKSEKRESKGPFLCRYGDFFHDLKEMQEYLEKLNEDNDTNLTLEDMQPYLAEPVCVPEFDLDYEVCELLLDEYGDGVTADGFCSKELIEAAKKLNEIIRNHPPISYKSTDYGLKL